MTPIKIKRINFRAMLMELAALIINETAVLLGLFENNTVTAEDFGDNAPVIGTQVPEYAKIVTRIFINEDGNVLVDTDETKGIHLTRLDDYELINIYESLHDILQKRSKP